MASFGNPNIDLVRKTLAVLLNAWNKKMQKPELIRGDAKPPVLNADTVSGWVHSLMGLRYMRVTDVKNGQKIYQEVPPDSSDPAKLFRYQELTKRIGNPAYMESLATRLNQALVDPSVLNNVLNTEFCSLLAMVMSNKLIKNDTGDIKASNGRVYDGKEYWFTLTAVANKVGDLNKLKGHLCTYMTYDSHDVSGGRSGKVIVCPTEAGGIKNIPQRIAIMINQTLRDKYNLDRDIAVVKPLSEITYNDNAGDEKNPRVKTITGIKNTGMTYGVDIDCSERIEVGGAFIDPRKAVSELFKSGELPITMTEFESNSTQSTEDRQHSMEDKIENSLANKADANLNRGHEMLKDQMDDSATKKAIGLIETRKSKLKTSVAILNQLANALNGDGSKPNTAWKYAEFKTPEKTDDQYLNFANYVTSVSDYIIESTDGMLSKEYAPFAYEVLFANHNVKFATNTIPRGKEHITLDRYANAMTRILVAINANLTDSSYKLMITNARSALSNLKLYEESVYQLLAPALKTYVNADVEKVEEKRKASDLAEKYQSAKINVALMDRYTGFDLAEKYGGMIKGSMTLGEYLDKVSAWVEKAASSKTFGNDDDAASMIPEKLSVINTALTSLLNGDIKSAAAAVGVLDKVIHAATATEAKPTEAPSTETPTKDVAPQKQPTPATEQPKKEEPPKQPVEEPKPVEKPAAEPTSDDDDDFNGDEI